MTLSTYAISQRRGLMSSPFFNPSPAQCKSDNTHSHLPNDSGLPALQAEKLEENGVGFSCVNWLSLILGPYFKKKNIFPTSVCIYRQKSEKSSIRADLAPQSLPLLDIEITTWTAATGLMSRPPWFVLAVTQGFFGAPSMSYIERWYEHPKNDKKKLHRYSIDSQYKHIDPKEHNLWLKRAIHKIMQ